MKHIINYFNKIIYFSFNLKIRDGRILNVAYFYKKKSNYL